MAIKIAIIGLQQIGASMGLALAQIKDQATRVGNDKDPGIARQAEKMGAVDKIAYGLPATVRDADMVILAVPVNDIRETLEIIAPELKPGVLVLDTSPVKEKVMQWAKELLSEDRYYVSVAPGINPAYLLESGEGVENAHADLFQKSLMLISSLPGIDESALALTTNFAQILGTTAIFSDTYEIDGLLASTHVLPKLAAAALVHTTTRQTGWQEARKMAGPAFAKVSEPALHLDEDKDLGKSILLNSENILRMLDQYLLELHDLRDAIASEETQTLHTFLEKAMQGREQWHQQRQVADWEKKAGQDIPLPSGSDILGRLFGIRPKKNN